MMAGLLLLISLTAVTTVFKSHGLMIGQYVIGLYGCFAATLPVEVSLSGLRIVKAEN